MMPIFEEISIQRIQEKWRKKSKTLGTFSKYFFIVFQDFSELNFGNFKDLFVSPCVQMFYKLNDSKIPSKGISVNIFLEHESYLWFMSSRSEKRCPKRLSGHTFVISDVGPNVEVSQPEHAYISVRSGWTFNKLVPQKHLSTDGTPAHTGPLDDFCSCKVYAC